jgi:hypothetical protein
MAGMVERACAMPTRQPTGIQCWFGNRKMGVAGQFISRGKLPLYARGNQGGIARRSLDIVRGVQPDQSGYPDRPVRGPALRYILLSGPVSRSGTGAVTVPAWFGISGPRLTLASNLTYVRESGEEPSSEARMRARVVRSLQDTTRLPIGRVGRSTTVGFAASL